MGDWLGEIKMEKYKVYLTDRQNILHIIAKDEKDAKNKAREKLTKAKADTYVKVDSVVKGE